jgi:surface antigen
VAVVVAVPPNGTMVVAESNYVGLAVLDLRLDPLNDPDILGFIVGSG